MKYCALAACLAVAACAPRTAEPEVRALQPDACHGGPVTLWLDFEGAGVVHAATDDSSAMPVASSLAPTNAVVPPFDSTAIAPKVTRDQAMAAIVDRVRTLLLPYAVDVVTARPAAAPYTRILVGGDASALGVSATEAGLATVDCGNGNDRDVAFDFAAAQTPDYGGVVGIANYAAHEAGHTFGLEHVDDPDDVMYAAAQPQLTLPGLFGAALRRRRRLHAVRLAVAARASAPRPIPSTSRRCSAAPSAWRPAAADVDGADR